MKHESPFNTVPPVILVLVMIVAGIEIVLSLAGAGAIGPPQAVGWRLAMIEDYAFAPRVLEWIVERGDYSWPLIRRFVTYPFVHLSFVHAAFACVMLLALGKFVGEAWSRVSLVLVILIATVVGALAHGLSNSENIPLMGFYPPVFGLIGAFTYVRWLDLGAHNQSRWIAFRLIGMLLGLQLLFGVMFGSAPHWVADVSGFVVGLAVSPLLGPGGWRAFLNRMRQRA